MKKNLFAWKLEMDWEIRNLEHWLGLAIRWLWLNWDLILWKWRMMQELFGWKIKVTRLATTLLVSIVVLDNLLRLLFNVGVVPSSQFARGGGRSYYQNNNQNPSTFANRNSMPPRDNIRSFARQPFPVKVKIPNRQIVPMLLHLQPTIILLHLLVHVGSAVSCIGTEIVLAIIHKLFIMLLITTTNTNGPKKNICTISHLLLLEQISMRTRYLSYVENQDEDCYYSKSHDDSISQYHFQLPQSVS